MAKPTPYAIPCPCGSGLELDHCCAPYLGGARPPPTAEALMRSRYTAYVVGNTHYLLETWHPARRPAFLELDHATRWLELRVLQSVAGGPDDTRGWVRFKARYKLPGGKGGKLEEHSYFERTEGRWLYVGEAEETP